MMPNHQRRCIHRRRLVINIGVAKIWVTNIGVAKIWVTNIGGKHFWKNIFFRQHSKQILKKIPLYSKISEDIFLFFSHQQPFSKNDTLHSTCTPFSLYFLSLSLFLLSFMFYFLFKYKK